MDRARAPNNALEPTAPMGSFSRAGVGLGGGGSPRALGAAPVHTREEEATGWLFRVALTRIWKGGSHEHPTCETVKPAEVSAWGNARGDGGAPGLAPQAGHRRAATRDDADQAVGGPEHLSSTPVPDRRVAAQRGVHRRALRRAREGNIWIHEGIGLRR